MRRRSTGRLILSIHFAFRGVRCGAWPDGSERRHRRRLDPRPRAVRQTDYQRMKITVVDGRVKVDTGGFPVESELRNGRLDLRRAGDG